MIQELLEVDLPKAGLWGAVGWRARPQRLRGRGGVWGGRRGRGPDRGEGTGRGGRGGRGGGGKRRARGPRVCTYPPPPGCAAAAPAEGPGPRAGPGGAASSCPGRLPASVARAGSRDRRAPHVTAWAGQRALSSRRSASAAFRPGPQASGGAGVAVETVAAGPALGRGRVCPGPVLRRPLLRAGPTSGSGSRGGEEAAGRDVTACCSAPSQPAAGPGPRPGGGPAAPREPGWGGA